MREQPVKPMDTIAFWIEHIIKYGGGSHLQNAGVDLSWYQLYMVDIYVFYTLALCLLAFIVIQTMRRIKRICFGRITKLKES